MKSYKLFASKEQRDIVKHKRKYFDNDRVIVVKGNIILDGNHHTVAAILSDKPIKYIDLNDIE